MDVLPAVTTSPRDGSRSSLSPPCEYGRSVATVDRVAVVTIVESLTQFLPLHTVPMVLRFVNER